ncbi:hypothetical protein [Bacillus wiedmannii]|uniref:Uncharacterized protein n=1 Tax=Bacillus wiedmannii TaxID=1890302 RepID=A0AA95LVP5_9BACI|nr:hypothetical protein [Bacillus wiedmannii]WHY30061.1 hypothetical protein QNH45_04580 [Bacillus wiedmannii]
MFSRIISYNPKVCIWNVRITNSNLFCFFSWFVYFCNEKSGPLYAKAIGGEVKAGAIIGGSASLGQAGGTVKVSSSGFKVNLPWGPGASPVGTGVEIEIK